MNLSVDDPEWRSIPTCVTTYYLSPQELVRERHLARNCLFFVLCHRWPSWCFRDSSRSEKIFEKKNTGWNWKERSLSTSGLRPSPCVLQTEQDDNRDDAVHTLHPHQLASSWRGKRTSDIRKLVPWQKMSGSPWEPKARCRFFETRMGFPPSVSRRLLSR